MRFAVALGAALLACGAAPHASAQVAPYNPYAAAEAPLPAKLPDGTIQWGTFYKSAQMQARYEQLWKLGACRGTNPDITMPVAANKLVVDDLAEAEFTGVVRATAGGLAGGMVAFTERADATERPHVAQFHPAGVTRLAVSGRAPRSVLVPGMIVRVRAAVDERGLAADPVAAFDILTPSAGFEPDAVRPGREGTIIGTVAGIRRDVLTLRVSTGSIRRITLPLAADAGATIVDAARLDLVAPGDEIQLKGRLWTGEGSMGAGTVFVSDAVVTKREAPTERAAALGQLAPR